MRCLIRLLSLLTISILLAGCQLYKEKIETFVPFEDIAAQKEAKTGIATLDSLRERVVLEVKGLPILAENNVYEAWLVDKNIDLKISIGTFRVDDNGYYLLDINIVKEDILDTDTVAVTLEPVPDVDSGPSDIIVLQGDIGGTADVMSVKLEAVEVEEPELPKEIIKIETPEEVPEEVVEEEVPEEIIEIEIPGEEVILPEDIVVEIPEEEVVEKEEKKEAIVMVVEETELVSLKTTATDPDADKITYAYSSPLNDKGEWQTNYGDAGEYTVTVTVSDGVLSASKDVLIIVNKKEEAPVIDNFSPLETELTTNENTKLEFSASASDVNKDELKYSWKLDGSEISTTKKAEYDITYDDAGKHTLKLGVTDGVTVVEKEWKITVNNVNRKPVLEAIPAINIKETETVTIEPKASDPDGDSLSYTISYPVGDDGVWQTTYDDAGSYNIIVTASDGVDSDTEEVKITVENVNRPPLIGEIINKR